MDDSVKDAPYRDATRAVPERVRDLTSRMTTEEKIAQLGAAWPPQIATKRAFDPARAAEAIPHGIGHITRIAGSGIMGPQDVARFANHAQRWLVEATRLGIPAIIHEESCAGFCAEGATQFPQSIGLAATWNPNLVEQIAGVIRQQMLAVGARHTLAPVLDIVRDARWGRVEETYGEDPYLAGRMGVAYVRGLQGDDIADGVICTGKHFLGYGAGEGGMNWAPAHLGRREILEVYARPFAEAIREAGLASIMNSYGEIDGEPSGGSKALLTDLLRGELGFAGTVVSDYFTVLTLLGYHRVAANKAEAAARALEAGIDVELPQLDCYLRLAEALAHGLIDEGTIDRACERVLRQKFELGLFERPFVDEDAAASLFDTDEQRTLARRAAQESIVLLKNEGGLLPLSPDASRIAVIGPAANSARLLQGDYHYPTHLEETYGLIREPHEEQRPTEPPESTLLPTWGTGSVDLSERFVRHVTLLEGIGAAASAETEIVYARGCNTYGEDRSGIAEAVEAAKQAETAIVCVGTRSGLTGPASSGEMTDRADLGLPGPQPALVDAVLATGTPVVVVLVNGGVLAIPEIAERAPAIVEAWLPAEEGGAAIADVLFGKVNPAGRLPVSMPRSVGQVPLFYNHKPSGGRSNIRGSYVDSPSTPLYPFGHGLSYTSFEYGPAEISKTEVSADGAVDVTVPVTNVGKRAGEEVVQLYLQDRVATITRPVKQLAGFVRIALEAGQTRRVTFRVDMSQLAFYGRDMRFIVEPGEVDVMIGASSEDIRQHVRFSITGEKREVKLPEVKPTAVEVT